MVCLDTSFLIDFLRGRAEAVSYLSNLQQTSDPITVAAPTVVELVEAASLGGSEKERNAIRQTLSSLSVLPLDAKAAWRAGEVSASLILSGEQIGQMDLLIGAVALAHEQGVVTRDVRHFSRIAGLQVEEYTKR
jgi:tRNA(fMet)-specific endonuclease VapC